ncbi:MAG TPA: hypothetical protein PK205_07090 [Promineifilum sp.]|nr:hypothetical protein [Promineifilum sp.]
MHEIVTREDKLTRSLRHTVRENGQTLGHIVEITKLREFYVYHVGNIARDNNKYDCIKDAIAALRK